MGAVKRPTQAFCSLPCEGLGREFISVSLPWWKEVG